MRTSVLTVKSRRHFVRNDGVRLPERELRGAEPHRGSPVDPHAGLALLAVQLQCPGGEPSIPAEERPQSEYANTVFLPLGGRVLLPQSFFEPFFCEL